MYPSFQRTVKRTSKYNLSRQPTVLHKYHEVYDGNCLKKLIPDKYVRAIFMFYNTNSFCFDFRRSPFSTQLKKIRID